MSNTCLEGECDDEYFQFQNCHLPFDHPPCSNEAQNAWFRNCRCFCRQVGSDVCTRLPKSVAFESSFATAAAAVLPSRAASAGASENQHSCHTADPVSARSKSPCWVSRGRSAAAAAAAAADRFAGCEASVKIVYGACCSDLNTIRRTFANLATASVISDYIF